ncbi:MAG: TetR family transcriptional regulator, partial [Myxococcota bacterium]|nr:TetR family transcriptional regulator [Myxococcota bacterium]
MAGAGGGSAVAPARRPRGSLSRGEILEAGLRIAKRDDLTSLTMKRLAEELGVTPMAIYRHFENKAEVIDGVLDLFVRDAAVTGHEPGAGPEAWRRWTVVTFRRMFDALTQTPGVMPFLSTASRFGPAATSALNAILDVLRRASMSEKEAVETFAVMCAYTVGAAGLATVSTRAQVAAFAIGWNTLRLTSAVQAVGQGALGVLLSYWVTAYFLNIYVPKLIFLVAAVALMAVWALVKGIFKRVRLALPVNGALLTEEAAPALWERVRAIASKVGTEAPSQIIAGIDDN